MVKTSIKACTLEPNMLYISNWNFNKNLHYEQNSVRSCALSVI